MWILLVIVGVVWLLAIAIANLSSYRSLSNPHPAHESNDYGEKHRTS